MIQILGENGVALELFVPALLGVEGIDLLVELVALVVDLLELLVGGLCVVGLLVDGLELALDPGEVLTHVEHS